MNKVELIGAIADKCGISKKDSEKAVLAFIETVEETLKKGEKVQLIGFGTFEVRERVARTGRNPRTGEPMEIDALRAPVFKIGKNLKEAVK